MGGCQHRGCLYAPYIHMPLHTPHTSVCSPYNICSPCHGDLGAISPPHLSWGLLGASVHLSGISVSVGTSICLSAHNSHTSCFPSLWGASLLDWMLMDVCYASCCCSFLCSVCIMSQASTTMTATTPTPVTVVCSGTSSFLSTVTMAPSLMGLPLTSGQHDVVLTPRHSGGVVGLATMPQQ